MTVDRQKFTHRGGIVPITQKTGECGPVSVAMLANSVHLAITPTQVINAAGIKSTVATQGATLQELAAGLAALSAGHRVLSMFDTNIKTLAAITNELGLPVGIKWQGAFVGDTGQAFDAAHYSVITGVDIANSVVSITDPEPRSCFTGGSIDLVNFQNRWWAENPILSETEGVTKILNAGLIFVVIQIEELPIAEALGFGAPNDALIYQHRKWT